MSDHDYCDSPNITNLSEYKQAANSYIAGYVAKTVQKQLMCPNCSDVLGSQHNIPASKLLALKDRGKLWKPSEKVITICKETEKCFQSMLATNEGRLPHTPRHS